jgi:hypothetical protein
MFEILAEKAMPECEHRHTISFTKRYIISVHLVIYGYK